jgi:DNA-binding NarL/FixJ family response regulator
MDKIRVLLVDDHSVMRAGLAVTMARDLALEVMGEAEDGVEVVQLVSELKPDVALMDLRLPGLDGIQATKEIGTTHPEAAVIILSAYDDAAYVTQAKRARARGYLIKDASDLLIRHTIKAAHKGESSLTHPHLREAAPDTNLYHRYEAKSLQHRHSLTPREMDVLKLLAEGLTNKAIARDLFISEVTAKKHVQGIIAKLDARDRTEAAVKAVRAGLLGL